MVKDSIVQGFQWATREGPLCEERELRIFFISDCTFCIKFCYLFKVLTMVSGLCSDEKKLKTSFIVYNV